MRKKLRNSPKIIHFITISLMFIDLYVTKIYSKLRKEESVLKNIWRCYL